MLLVVFTCIAFQSATKSYTEKTSSKNINFLVYSDNAYTAAVYKDALAQVEVVISRQVRNKKLVVCSKTWRFEKLQNFPCLQNAEWKKFVIDNIKNKRESFEVQYILTYYSRGSLLTISKNMVFTANSKNETIFINV